MHSSPPSSFFFSPLTRDILRDPFGPGGLGESLRPREDIQAELLSRSLPRMCASLRWVAAGHCSLERKRSPISHAMTLSGHFSVGERPWPVRLRFLAAWPGDKPPQCQVALGAALSATNPEAASPQSATREETPLWCRDAALPVPSSTALFRGVA